MKNNKLSFDEYMPEDPLEFLKCYENKEGTKEVLFTFGDQEILKENGKFYLSNTINPYYNKEITRESATELWQSHNMKQRDDFSLDFDLT